MLTNYNTFPPFNYCSTSATCQFIAKSLCAIERSCDHGKIVRYIGIAVFMQTVYYRFILTDIVHLYSSPDELLHTAAQCTSAAVNVTIRHVCTADFHMSLLFFTRRAVRKAKTVIFLSQSE